jgi:hypothetical protein
MVTTPTQNTAARLYALAGEDEGARIAAAYDFDLYWEDDSDGRTLMLLGPDSPAEMTLKLTWWQLDSRNLVATTSMALQWMIDRGNEWRGRDVDWLALREAAFATERNS